MENEKRRQKRKWETPTNEIVKEVKTDKNLMEWKYFNQTMTHRSDNTTERNKLKYFDEGRETQLVKTHS